MDSRSGKRGEKSARKDIGTPGGRHRVGVVPATTPAGGPPAGEHPRDPSPAGQPSPQGSSAVPPLPSASAAGSILLRRTPQASTGSSLVARTPLGRAPTGSTLIGRSSLGRAPAGSATPASATRDRAALDRAPLDPAPGPEALGRAPDDRTAKRAAAATPPAGDASAGPAAPRRAAKERREAAKTSTRRSAASRRAGHPPSESRLRRLLRLPFVLGWMLFLLVRSAPLVAVTVLVLQVVIAAATGAQLLLLTDILTRADAAGPGQQLTAVGPQLGVLVGVFGLVTLAGMFLSTLRVLLSERVSWYTSEQILDVTTAADAVHYEDREFLDRLDRAHRASTRPVVITQNVLAFIGSVSALGSLAVVLFLLEPLLVPLILTLAVPLISARSTFSRRMQELTTAFTERDRRRGYLRGLLTARESAAEVRAYGLSTFLRRRNQYIYEEQRNLLRRLVRDTVPRFLANGIFATLVLAGAVGWIAALVLSGRLPVIAATVGAAALLQFNGAISALVVSAGQLHESAPYLTDLRRFRALLPGLRAARGPAGDEPAPHDFQAITVNDVSFRYPNAQHPAVHGVSMRIRRGEVVALVGGEGAGKTTLAKLLCNLYRPTEGRIAWDGRDITRVDPDKLRESIAVLFQDYGRYLFTAGENIGLGRVDDIADRMGIDIAAVRSGASSFLRHTPAGYNTQLGRSFPGGVNLSGGQWQRLALARAFFRAAPLVILDEPGAAMSPRSEQDMYESMRELYAGSTLLLVSRRLNSVRFADRIYVMDQGRIVEGGSHFDLMRADGLYAYLYRIEEHNLRSRRAVR